MNFEELNLVPDILRAVQELDYTRATPIQAEAIPVVLEGSDLLAGAQTGTGKTAAFALPILQILSGRAPQQAGAIRTLILTPTRELAAQIGESVQAYGKYLSLQSTVIFGGVGQNPQIDRIQAGCDILIATPGRLLDLQEQGFIDLSHVEILVLDEADRMLDMGFIHDVKKVLALLPGTQQSLLFSATFTDDVRELAESFLAHPKSIQVTPPNTTVERIKQVIYPVGRARKKDVLVHLITENKWNQVLVFTRTKFGANRVADFLNEHGITAMALHGNKSQTARTQALNDFKHGGLCVLVATDIAARGIDIDELPAVVNFDIPNVPEDYVHRIGRTGRAGADGEAASLVCLDEEGFMHAIERFTAQQIPVKILDGFGPEPDEKAEPIAMGRQTLWGGLGRPPSREVMQAAARAARREMMERMRESRGRRQQHGRGANHAEHGAGDAPAAGHQEAPRRGPGAPQDGNHAGDSRDFGNGGRRRRHRSRGRGGFEPNQEARAPRFENAGAEGNGADQGSRGSDGDGYGAEPDRLPRNVDPLQINLHKRNVERRVDHDVPRGQPDPLRTSVDMMGRGAGRGHGGGNNGGKHRRFDR